MSASRLVSAARLAATLCVLAGAPVLAAGSVSDGHALAQAWCSSCHMVDPSGQGSDTAPPFATIAAKKPGDNGWLRAWLASPHPPMPNLGLSRQQIDDIVAYLNSLAPH